MKKIIHQIGDPIRLRTASKGRILSLAKEEAQ
jgi:hypothetical protein